MELSPGMVVADRFRLERELGKGGMGAVWLARHLSLDVPCAIKFILAHAASSPELRGRFEREARAAAHIRSPHVVQILDYGVWQETPYIAMEYLEGEDLGERLARRGRLDARETATIIGQVARALAKAHAAGIVHRDIKPSNIFLVRDDDQELAKVVDFGIAKGSTTSSGGGQTRTGALLGTPYYMSPEQAQGNRTVDHRSDLWALAVVTYQCLTGRLPFESDGLGDLVMMIMNGPPPVPSRVAPVPPGFDAWWARATAHDPAQRFQTARELAESLYLALGISAPDAAELHDNGLSRRDPLDPIVSTPKTPSTPLGAVLPARAAPRPRGHAGAVIAAIAGAALIAGATALAVVARPAPGLSGAMIRESSRAAISSAPAEPLSAAAATTSVDTPAPSATAPPPTTSASAPPLASSAPSAAPSARPAYPARAPATKATGSAPSKPPAPRHPRDFGI
ncbi:MAG: serine/threonine-protein kinase [Byssovorax sp.]